LPVRSSVQRRCNIISMVYISMVQSVFETNKNEQALTSKNSLCDWNTSFNEELLLSLVSRLRS